MADIVGTSSSHLSSRTDRIEVSDGPFLCNDFMSGEVNPLSGLVGRDESNPKSERSKTEAALYAELGELGAVENAGPGV